MTATTDIVIRAVQCIQLSDFGCANRYARLRKFCMNMSHRRPYNRQCFITKTN